MTNLDAAIIIGTPTLVILLGVWINVHQLSAFGAQIDRAIHRMDQNYKAK